MNSTPYRTFIVSAVCPMLLLLGVCMVARAASEEHLKVSTELVKASVGENVNLTCTVFISENARAEWRKLDPNEEGFRTNWLYNLDTSDLRTVERISIQILPQQYLPTVDGKVSRKQMTLTYSNIGENDAGQYLCLLHLPRTQQVFMRITNLGLKKESPARYHGKGTSSVSSFVHHDLHPGTNDETMRPNQKSEESQLVPTETWNRSSGSQDNNLSHTDRQPGSRNTTANLHNILARPLHASLLSKVFEGKIIQGDDIDDQDGTKLHEFPKEQYTVSIIILILVVIMIILLVVTIPLVVICSVKGRPRYDSLNTDL